jgi:hypothetical protein
VISTYVLQQCLAIVVRSFNVGYLCHNTSSATRIRVKIPYHEWLDAPGKYDRSSSVFGTATMELPLYHPIPSGL